VQGRTESRWRVIAHRRGGRGARLARGGIREHDTFLGHEMRGPAGTGLGGVSMAGGREGQGARKWNGVRGHLSQVTYRGQGDTGHNQRHVMKVRTRMSEKAENRHTRGSESRQ